MEHTHVARLSPFINRYYDLERTALWLRYINRLLADVVTFEYVILLKFV